MDLCLAGAVPRSSGIISQPYLGVNSSTSFAVIEGLILFRDFLFINAYSTHHSLIHSPLFTTRPKCLFAAYNCAESGKAKKITQMIVSMSL